MRPVLLAPFVVLATGTASAGEPDPKPLVFAPIVLTSDIPKPAVSILPVRQDVTTDASLPVQSAPLLPKVVEAVERGRF